MQRTVCCDTVSAHKVCTNTPKSVFNCRIISIYRRTVVNVLLVWLLKVIFDTFLCHLFFGDFIIIIIIWMFCDLYWAVKLSGQNCLIAEVKNEHQNWEGRGLWSGLPHRQEESRFASRGSACTIKVGNVSHAIHWLVLQTFVELFSFINYFKRNK